MTQLLEKAIAEAKNSPPDVQDAIANLILAELQDEHAWRQSFENTSDEQWDKMAEAVRKEIESSHSWSEQDQRDVTAASLQYATTIYPEDEDLV